MANFFEKVKLDSYFVVMILIAISLPFSKFTLSVFQLLLIIIWIGDDVMFSPIKRFFRQANIFRAIWLSTRYVFLQLIETFVKKIRFFLSNRVALILASLFFLHIVGLITTSDFDYAWKDLRIKLPLLVLPLVMSSMRKFTLGETKTLLGFFVASVFTGTLISFVHYLQKDFNDIRDISIYISSVRFSLMVVFSFFLVLNQVITGFRQKHIFGALFMLIAVWLLAYLVILESVIGLLSVVIIGTVLLVRLVLKIGSKKWRVALFVITLGLPLTLFLYLNDIVKELTYRHPIDIEKLDKFSRLGNEYRHDTINFGVEDGKYVGIYFAESEMAEAWNERSSYDFYGKDDAGQLIMYTIIRYLTSADLRKDADGVSQLTAEDIRYIEKGIANKRYVENPSLRNRISKIIVGYQQFTDLNDPNGSSIMQRVEHLKASKILIKQYFLFGVGTGDLPEAFRSTYNTMNSPLREEVRWRSHNQYLSILIAFGVFGWLWFIIVLVYPALYSKKILYTEFLIFWLLMLLSMLSEDTIETQIGVTLFAFFFSFLLITANRNLHSK